MRFSVVASGFLVLALSTFLVARFLRVPPPQETTPPPTKANDVMPPLSETGPYPKTVVDRTEFDFGRMEVGDAQSHEFTIRNEGEAPLILKKGPTTCLCTISDIPNNRVDPGKSATVK